MGRHSRFGALSLPEVDRCKGEEGAKMSKVQR